MKSALNSRIFLTLLKENKLPRPEAEYRFDKTRRWRFDWAWPKEKIACEQEGGIWTTHSRHTRGSGFVKDMEKYNKAALLGWKVLRYSPSQMQNEAIRDLKEIMGEKNVVCLFCGAATIKELPKGLELKEMQKLCRKLKTQ